MTILETVKGIINHEEAEQKMRVDGLKFKDDEIIKYRKIIIGIQERKVEIGNEILESDAQIFELKKIKRQLEEAVCGVQGSQN